SPPEAGHQAGDGANAQGERARLGNWASQGNIVDHDKSFKARQRRIDFDQLEGGDSLKTGSKEDRFMLVGLGDRVHGTRGRPEDGLTGEVRHVDARQIEWGPAKAEGHGNTIALEETRRGRP